MERRRIDREKGRGLEKPFENPYRDRTNNRERTELENPDFGRIFELRSARTELLSKSELTSGHSIEW